MLMTLEGIIAQSNGNNIQSFIYLPSSPTAQDGIIDLIINSSAGTPPFTVKYYKKQQNGQFDLVKEVVANANGDEDYAGIGAGNYKVEVIDLHCAFISLDVPLNFGCTCTPSALTYVENNCTLTWNNNNPCPEYSMMLQREGIGYWENITSTSAYSIPQGMDGNYRLAWTKEECIAAYSNVITTDCANSGEVSTGSLIINEFSQGCQGQEEYIEFIVTGSTQYVTIEGMIIDDNNHVTFEHGNESGHIRLGSCFNYIKVGTILIIYNNDDLNPEIDPVYDGKPSPADDNVWQVPFNDACLIKYPGCPDNFDDYDGYNCQAGPNSGGWSDYIPLRNLRDVVQVRNPNATLVQAIIYGGANFDQNGGLGIINLPDSTFTSFYRSNGQKWRGANPCQKESPGEGNDTLNVTYVNEIANIDKNNLVVTPNPATHTIKVLSNLKIQRIEIFSTENKKVFDIKNVKDVELDIDLGNLLDGVYILRIHTADGSKRYKKFVKLNY